MGKFLREPRVIHVTTVPQTLAFFHGQVGYMKERGLVVHAVSSPGEKLNEFGDREGVPVYGVEMTRRITPVRDLVALWQLWVLFRRLRPHIVHSHTPKGGLLGTIAAWLARVPVRIYNIHGFPYMTAKGPKRWLLQWTERTSCRLSHRVLCVSRSIRDVAMADRISASRGIGVLLNGSTNGVDSQGRFNPAIKSAKMQWQLRESLGIPRDALVIGYVGRIVRDKGLVELIEAWKILRGEYPFLHMVVVGSFEPQDPLPQNVEGILRGTQEIHLVGQTKDPSTHYSIMDVVVLPTYREGLPNVPLEAAAMSRPVVATSIPGCIDVVVDGETGTLVPPRDELALAEAIRRYLQDPELRRRHGLGGRERILRDFRQEVMWEGLYQEYVRLLSENGFPIPEAPFQKLGTAVHVGDSDRPVSIVGDSLMEANRTQGGAGPIIARGIKRLCDLIAASLVLILLAPVMALVGLAIRLTMGGPVLFRQVRPGYQARPFPLYKFRTMTEAYDNDGAPRPDAERLTRLGRLLRRASLDELPQLWNVLRGDLSLVGPRPLLMHYLPLYTSEQARRHDVKPGITGWAQVHGRNAISWEDKFSYDVWYVDHWSLWLDLKILILTLVKVARQTGISHDGHATMQEFAGTTGRP